MEVSHTNSSDPNVSKETEVVGTDGGGYHTSWLEVATVMIPCITLALVTVIGNGLIIYAYIRSADVRNLPFNVYILHLSVADFVVGLYNLPVESVDFALRVWLSPWVIPMLHIALVTSTTAMSLNIVIMMSYDRYQLVTDPLRYQRTRTKRANSRLMIMTWTVSIVYSIAYSCLVLLTFEDHKVVFTVCDITFNFIVPLVILLTLNIGVYVKLAEHWRSNDGTKRISIAHWGNENSSIVATDEGGKCRCSKSCETGNESTIGGSPFGTASQDIKVLNTSSPWSGVNSELVSGKPEITPPPSFASRDVKLNVQRKGVHNIKSINKTVRNLSIFVVAFLVCWLPLRCLFTLRSLSKFGDEEILRDIGVILLYSNSAINPFIYAVMNRRYRKSLIAIFKKFSCRLGANGRLKTQNQ